MSNIVGKKKNLDISFKRLNIFKTSEISKGIVPINGTLYNGNIGENNHFISDIFEVVPFSGVPFNRFRLYTCSVIIMASFVVMIKKYLQFL